MTADGASAPRVIRAERQQGGRREVGEVTVAGGGDPAVADERAAAGRAWLAVARSFLASGDGDDAYRAASRGLDELGDAYLDEGVEDDTTLKLLAAEDGHDSGADHAGTAMTRVLESRLAMYVDAQRGRVR